MSIDEFQNWMKQQQRCPSDLPKPLQALWHDRKGDWDTAHEIVQNASDSDSAWVHAYLHRKEGDYNNARYWYRRSGQPEFSGTLQEEWKQIATDLLVKQKV